MKNLLNKFQTELSNAVLDFLWSAWSQVGVMGGRAPSRPIVVDPEPLLLVTLECARRAPRVFDEVLDWLVQNGHWINVGRLAVLLEEDQVCVPTIIGAVAAFMAEHDKTPKWRNLAQLCLPKSPVTPRPLFRHRELPALNWPQGRIFLRYGWQRSAVRLRGQSQPFPAWSPASLILKSRALFGVTIRADAFAYLVANGPATASHTARELGYSQRRVQDALMEMELGGQFRTRFDGNRKEYSIDSNKGWPWLFEAMTERAAWFNWRAYARAISKVWNAAFIMKEEGLTDYIFESEMAKALEAARPDFAAAGIPVAARQKISEFVSQLRGHAKL